MKRRARKSPVKGGKAKATTTRRQHRNPPNRERLQIALDAMNGNQSAVARHYHVHRRTVDRWMVKYGLSGMSDAAALADIARSNDNPPLDEHALAPGDAPAVPPQPQPQYPQRRYAGPMTPAADMLTPDMLPPATPPAAETGHDTASGGCGTDLPSDKERWNAGRPISEGGDAN